MVSSPEEYHWSSCPRYLDGSAPSWLSTGLVLGYFGPSEKDRPGNYRAYLMEAVGEEGVDPLAGSIASTILGTDEFIRDIREKYLEGMEPVSYTHLDVYKRQVHREHIPDWGEIYRLLFLAAVKPELILGENVMVEPPVVV